MRFEFQSNYYNYDDPIPCPYCGSKCHADFVDIGIGMEQCGPYHCESCHAYELKAGYNGVPETWSEKEQETGWREPAEELQITCIGCGLTPSELVEYVECAEAEDMTPTEYVIHNEGTYNAFLKHKFYCTCCYINAGQPTAKRHA